MIYYVKINFAQKTYYSHRTFSSNFMVSNIFFFSKRLTCTYMSLITIVQISTGPITLDQIQRKNEKKIERWKKVDDLIANKFMELYFMLLHIYIF